MGTNPYTGNQDWIYTGGYFNRNYQDLPDIYWYILVSKISLSCNLQWPAPHDLQQDVMNPHTSLYFCLHLTPSPSSSSWLPLPAHRGKTYTGTRSPLCNLLDVYGKPQTQHHSVVFFSTIVKQPANLSKSLLRQYLQHNKSQRQRVGTRDSKHSPQTRMFHPDVKKNFTSKLKLLQTFCRISLMSKSNVK